MTSRYEHDASGDATPSYKPALRSQKSLSNCMLSGLDGLAVFTAVTSDPRAADTSVKPIKVLESIAVPFAFWLNWGGVLQLQSVSIW